MTNQTPESVIAEALNAWPRVSESSPNLGVADYLTEALRAANMLREPGKSDVATEELARIKPLFENYSREYPNECNKRVKAEAERDAATAALERVRATVEGPHPANSGLDSFTLAHILAALDGAPEPNETETVPGITLPAHMRPRHETRFGYDAEGLTVMFIVHPDGRVIIPVTGGEGCSDDY